MIRSRCNPRVMTDYGQQTDLRDLTLFMFDALRQRPVATSFAMNHVLHRDNRKALEGLWGKRDGTWTGSYRFDVWKRQFEGYTFYVLSAREKGTCYEASESVPDDVCLRFLESCHRALETGA